MAERRHRIVHHADLSAPTATLIAVWSIADEWQIIMWLMAVPAFYYKMRIALRVASDDDRTRLGRLETAIGAHVELGHKIMNFSKLPAEELCVLCRRLLTAASEPQNFSKAKLSNPLLMCPRT